MNGIYLAFGSNLGDRFENIHAAVRELEKTGVVLERLSTVIETDPVGGPPQGKYLNAVGRFETDLPPFQLLDVIQSVEKKMGRVRTVLNGPRVIDIDILLYNQERIDTPNLTVPHPRMFDRAFVMTPLKEISGCVPEACPKALDVCDEVY